MVELIWWATKTLIKIGATRGSVFSRSRTFCLWSTAEHHFCFIECSRKSKAFIYIGECVEGRRGHIHPAAQGDSPLQTYSRHSGVECQR